MVVPVPGSYSELVGATSPSDCIACPAGTFSIPATNGEADGTGEKPLVVFQDFIQFLSLEIQPVRKKGCLGYGLTFQDISGAKEETSSLMVLVGCSMYGIYIEY